MAKNKDSRVVVGAKRASQGPRGLPPQPTPHTTAHNSKINAKKPEARCGGRTRNLEIGSIAFVRR
jgi:hypothetical protein